MSNKKVKQKDYLNSGDFGLTRSERFEIIKASSPSINLLNKINHPFLSNLIYKYLIINNGNHKNYYHSILTEAYEQRNFFYMLEQRVRKPVSN